jgi:hypothetical protein
MSSPAQAGPPPAQEEESTLRKLFSVAQVSVNSPECHAIRYYILTNFTLQQVFLIWAFSQLGASKLCGSINRLIGNCLAMKLISPAKPPDQAPPVATPGSDSVQPGQVNPFLLPPTQALPAWKLGQPLSMHVYFSTSPNGDVFSRQWTSAWREDQDAGLPNFVWENITFGDWKDTRVATYDINLPLVSCLT